MSANLITGNLFKPIYAYQDADYQAGISGNVTSIMPVGSQMALSIEDANTIKADDGVLITKEGRRIQIDAGAIEEWSIPTGTQGATNYFIIGFHLYTDSNSAEVCETFVEQMENATDTIPEGTFREGSTEVYVSLGRVVQNGINLDSVTSLVQIAQSIEDIRNAIALLDSNIDDVSNDLATKYSDLNSRIKRYMATPTNLANFVQNTAVDTNSFIFCHFKDTNNVLGFGANVWLKGYLLYQNLYGAQWSVDGEGIFYTSGANAYYVRISGSSTFTVTRKIISTTGNNTKVGGPYDLGTDGASKTFSLSTSLAAFNHIGLYLSNSSTSTSNAIVITCPISALTGTNRFPIAYDSWGSLSGCLTFKKDSDTQVKLWTSSQIEATGFRYVTIYAW